MQKPHIEDLLWPVTYHQQRRDKTTLCVPVAQELEPHKGPSLPMAFLQVDPDETTMTKHFSPILESRPSL